MDTPVTHVNLFNAILALYVIGYQIESLSRGLGLIYLVIAFIIYLISLNYVTRYYRPNVLEIGIGYNFYILSGLFAISSDN